jgi:hypothetical protein
MLFCCCWGPVVDISSVPSVSTVPAVACLSSATDIPAVSSIHALGMILLLLCPADADIPPFPPAFTIADVLLLWLAALLF